MKPVALLLAIACTLPAAAQDSARKRPEPPASVPADPGAVVKPPPTGNEEIVKTPKNVDPKIDDGTPDIDRKNRDKARKKESAR